MVAVLGTLLLGLAACSGTESPTPQDPPPDGSAPQADGAWPSPTLQDVERVEAPPDGRLRLEMGRDYVVALPRRLRVPEGLRIEGGRNVVVEPGRIEVPPGGRPRYSRGLYLVGQTGTVHVQGVTIGGRGLVDGVVLDERLGAIVQLVDVEVERARRPADESIHADVLQTWGGPRELRIDGLRATTEYQGLFLHPQQYEPVEVRRFDLRDVDIVGTESSVYLLWQATPFPLELDGVRVTKPAARPAEQIMWPSPREWPGVRVTDLPTR